MKTLEEIKSWLKTPDHVRRILVEVEGVITGPSTTTNYYFSNGAFISKSTDTPASTQYLPIIVGGINFSESFSLDGQLTLSYGEIELDNTNGTIDSLINYIWANKVITMYLGDPNWPKDDYKILFSGYVADLRINSRNSLNLVITDRLQKLNTVLSEATILQESKNNTDELLPVCLGECFNITPLINKIISGVNAGTTYYYVHNTAIEDIIEVRDNGAPVSFTKDLTNGRFTLDQAAFGQITCSVQGHKQNNTYTNKIGEIIKNLVKYYGTTQSQFIDSDFDSTFTDLDTSFTVGGVYKRPIGYYNTSRQNLLSVCNQLADTVRAKLSVNVGPLASDANVGKLKLVKLEIGTVAKFEITSSDIEQFSISLGEKSTVRAATKLAYCKNYTVQQSGLAAGLPQDSVSLFNTEWLYASVVDATVKTQYSLNEEPQPEETLLITNTGASEEAIVRNNLWKTPRFICNMVAYAHLFDIQLGDCVSITNRRFNLTNRLGTVISVSRDWLGGRINLGVLI